MKAKLVIAGVLVAIAAALAYSYFFTGGLAPRLTRPRPLCLLNVSVDGGVEGVEVSPVGGRACPATYRVRVVLKRGFRLVGVDVGGRRFSSTVFNVTVSGNETLRVYTRRVRVAVHIVVNASAPYLVNGSRRVGDVAVEAPLGARLNLTPLAAACLEPLNSSTTLVVEGNETLRLYWAVRRVEVRLSGNYSGPVLVNGTPTVLVNGSTVLRLPCGSVVNVTPLSNASGGVEYVPLNKSLIVRAYNDSVVHLYWAERCNGVHLRDNIGRIDECVEPPVSISLKIAGPLINATHRWWLAWYWVEENGSRHWWSPGINGSTLTVKRPANVTAVYLPGLRDLPYVVRYYRWPEEYARVGGYSYWVEGGYLCVNASREITLICCGEASPWKEVSAMVSMPRTVGVARVEAYVPDGSPGHILAYPLAWGGFTAGFFVPGRGLVVLSNASLVNETEIRMRYEREHNLTLYGIGVYRHFTVPGRRFFLVNFSAVWYAWRTGDWKAVRWSTVFPGMKDNTEYGNGGILNPNSACCSHTGVFVYRWPSGYNLLYLEYFVYGGRLGSRLCVRVVGVAPPPGWEP